MKIWVDADACPRVIKDVLYKVAMRRQLKMTLVSNQELSVPDTEWIDTMLVPKGFDVADEEIVRMLQAGDVVITADIPLADLVVKKAAHGLDFRGDLYHEDNIQGRLATRDLMAQLRDTGWEGGGPPPFNPKDRQKFVNALDRLLTRLLKVD